MTSSQTRRKNKARQERNQRIMWALQDALGLVLIGVTVYVLGLLVWGLV